MGRRAHTTAGLLAAVAALAGCAGDGRHANEPRPPTPVNVTAAITRDGLTVSPSRFGAGPVVILIANETPTARSVTVETDALGADRPGLRRHTAPIDPQNTATLKLDMPKGRYTISAGGRGGGEAGLRVGRPRPSSSDELLTP